MTLLEGELHEFLLFFTPAAAHALSPFAHAQGYHFSPYYHSPHMPRREATCVKVCAPPKHFAQQSPVKEGFIKKLNLTVLDLDIPVLVKDIPVFKTPVNKRLEALSKILFTLAGPAVQPTDVQPCPSIRS